MGTNLDSGLNYSFDGRTVDFFGAKGMHDSDGESWIINLDEGPPCIQVDPDSMMPVIHEIILGDIDDGNEDRIAQVQMGPRQAVVFFLEGMLSRDHLASAVEGPGYIDLPDVEIDDIIVTVRVLEEPTYRVATADSEGVVI